MYYEREYVAAGGLMSYGPIEKDSFRLAGIYAAVARVSPKAAAAQQKQKSTSR